MSPPPLRTVLVGFGAVAEGLAGDRRMAAHFRYATHAQVLRDHPAFHWQAVVDPRPEARARAAEDWGIGTAAASLETLDDRPGFDAAVLATPPGHRLDALRALPSLRRLMVEKPLGDEGEELVATCRERGIDLQVNYWRRGDAAMQALAAGGLAEAIGPVQAGFATYGNGLMNNAGHLVDLLRLLLGEVADTQALGPAVPAPDNPGDTALAMALRFRSGVLVTVQPLDFRHYREIGVDLWGTAGRLALTQEGLAAQHFPVAANRGLEGAREVSSDAPEPIQVTVGEALYRLYDDLAAGGELLSPGASALATEAVLEAALASA